MNMTNLSNARDDVKNGHRNLLSFVNGPLWKVPCNILSGTAFTGVDPIPMQRGMRGRNSVSNNDQNGHSDQNVSRKQRQPCTVLSVEYLSPSSLDVDFTQLFRSGSFGTVFLGRYFAEGNENGNIPLEVVVKCPVNSDLGRKLYDMERHTNFKLRQRNFLTSRFPNLLGEVIIPEEMTISPGLVRLGLVWERSGDGNTLEDYLSSGRVSELANMLGTTGVANPLRRQLSATILRELALIVEDIQQCGIVHRDIKPENCLIVSPTDVNRTSPESCSPIQVIDFGSSCDWNSLTKKGLRLATCDPIYTAPEKRLNVFQPALKFDVYSIALIALRVAFPSITDANAFDRFVTSVMQKGRSSIDRVCTAVDSGRIAVSPDLKADFNAFTREENEDLYAVMATMLTEDPGERATASDCLRARFVQNGGY